MTPDQLEREILEAWGYGTYSKITLNNAKKAAQICREHLREVAEKAIDDAVNSTLHQDVHGTWKQEWLKENNLL